MIKEVDGVTTVFHYDFSGNIIVESDLDGSFNTEYLYNGKGRVALVNVITGEMFYFLNDRLGTPQMLTDASNTVVWEGLYKPFGEADVNPNSSVVNNFRFPGQYFDQETGLHYNWHRYYDPATGRYLKPDPIGLLGGINLWTYAQNNPINRIDPFGLIAEADPFNPAPNIPKNMLTPNPIKGLIPGADSTTGPMAFYGAGASLIIIGGDLAVYGAGMIATGGPVGWIGGTIVTGTGIVMWGSGIWTAYQGWQVDHDDLCP